MSQLVEWSVTAPRRCQSINLSQKHQNTTDRQTNCVIAWRRASLECWLQRQHSEQPFLPGSLALLSAAYFAWENINSCILTVDFVSRATADADGLAATEAGPTEWNFTKDNPYCIIWQWQLNDTLHSKWLAKAFLTHHNPTGLVKDVFVTVSDRWITKHGSEHVFALTPDPRRQLNCP